MLRGGEVKEIIDYKRQGFSITDISALTGHSRPTVRKYLVQQKTPRYGPREPRSTVLDPYKPFLEERLAAGVWNAVVLLRELKERGYPGGDTAVKDFVRPKRREARTVNSGFVWLCRTVMGKVWEKFVREYPTFCPCGHTA